jgi:hypothetical protein
MYDNVLYRSMPDAARRDSLTLRALTPPPSLMA